MTRLVDELYMLGENWRYKNMPTQEEKCKQEANDIYLLIEQYLKAEVSKVGRVGQYVFELNIQSLKTYNSNKLEIWNRTYEILREMLRRNGIEIDEKFQYDGRYRIYLNPNWELCP